MYEERRKESNENYDLLGLTRVYPGSPILQSNATNLRPAAYPFYQLRTCTATLSLSMACSRHSYNPSLRKFLLYRRDKITAVTSR